MVEKGSILEGRTIQVAMVNTAIESGGAAKMAVNLCRAINRLPKNVSAKLYHSEDAQILKDVIGLKKNGSRYLNAGLERLAGNFAAYDLGFSREFLKLTSGADILHLHNLHGYYVNSEELIDGWGVRPIVWTWHDAWGATGRCCSPMKCTLWKSGCSRCPNMSNYPASWIDNADADFVRKKRLFGSLANLWIVSPSAWLAEIACQSGFNKDRVVVIPNPVDTNKFRLIPKKVARGRLGIADDVFVPLFLAADCGAKSKGYDDFAEATANPNWHPIAVGKMPKNVGEFVNHVGLVKDIDLLNHYYAAADVMIIPSYADNYPNTVIESMASGTPVIGYDEGGISSQLESMPECVVVSRGNVSELRRAVDSFSSGQAYDASKGDLLRDMALQRWESTRVAAKYVQLYERVSQRL